MSVRIPLFSCSGSWGVLSSNSGCSAHNNICAYTQYGDGSGTSGAPRFNVFFFHRLNSDEPKAEAFYQCHIPTWLKEMNTFETFCVSLSSIDFRYKEEINRPSRDYCDKNNMQYS
ncbi:hypothetical protein Bca101_097343 [Brassica carinata]